MKMHNCEWRLEHAVSAWVRTGKYTFEYNLIKYSVNPDGSYARAEHINQKNELNQTFDKFTGNFTANVEATRIEVDPGTYPT